MDHPHDLFERRQEWERLSELCNPKRPGWRIGLLYGRRRVGKSFLLRRVSSAHGGHYSLAFEESRSDALRRFGDEIAQRRGLPADTLSFDNWEVALRTALVGPQATVLIIDEFPFLLRHSPELPSVLQHLYDEHRHTSAANCVTIILCGSAMSVMAELLSGTKPLRGRAELSMRLDPFGYRTAARFWTADDHDVALHLDAIFGGSPGYRSFVTSAPVASVADLGGWLGRSVLRPGHMLYEEADYLLREDPRISDRALYHSILRAIAAGEASPARIGARMGRDRTSLAHALGVLTEAGFVTDDSGVLKQRDVELRVVDPIVRFDELILRRFRPLLEDGRFDEAWNAAQPTFKSKILGPHFEVICRDWTRRHASVKTLGDRVGWIGRAKVNDPAARTQREVDVVALAVGASPQQSDDVVAIGEAKAADRERTMADVFHLEHVRSLVHSSRRDKVKLLLFGRSGFDDAVIAAAASRDDLELIDLTRLYEGS